MSDLEAAPRTSDLADGTFHFLRAGKPTFLLALTVATDVFRPSTASCGDCTSLLHCIMMINGDFDEDFADNTKRRSSSPRKLMSGGSGDFTEAPHEQ